ncbi:uncharacterized protein B0I36DRAFT_378434 [Microdochium trichocladiopsis]|uniref:Cerato-platanin n=1 Tax=Microdochium trichocladiopsis TaxID=1682393 RepID=A0A9P8XQK1_9PEZI|nr:uncharacterized protein B0I36DRAFT_378434 [Microdochium trichocladiopsis]KAH7012159.1 hypothetical protein B0I36DRAFT_378434 [Microdochium trichocladiopsis]
MQYSFVSASAAATTVPSGVDPRSGSIWVTPHDRYSSSIGVLGCKINTNRVAYWPSPVSCDKLCVKVTANDRSVTLLKVDQSGGAYDVSYDAWNYLVTGQSARENPAYGAGIVATWEDVDMSQCSDLLAGAGGKLPLTAANSMNYVFNCGADTWAAKNYALYNIVDSVCTLGYDELCVLPPPSISNQPSCPNTLGAPVHLNGKSVINIDYGTGHQSSPADPVPSLSISVLP